MIIYKDCFETLDRLHGKRAAIVTDPPYGLKEENFEEVFLFLESASKLAPMIVILDWRNSHLMSLLPKCGELIWEYGWVSGGRTKTKTGFFPTHNTIHLIGDKANFRFIGGSIIKRQPGMSSPRQCSFAHKTGHEHEKPVKLMEMLIDGLVNIDYVVDPFCGSGSTGVAAVRKKKKFIGAEKSPVWAEYSRSRINNEFE